MLNLLFRNRRNTNSGLPAILTGARADVPNALNGFVWAGTVKDVFQRVADKGIADGDTEKSKNDPGFGPVFPNKE